jgi:restriction system protein
MNAWMVRGGKFGEFESIALENNLVCLGFNELPDLRKAKSESATRDLVRAAYPAASTARVSNFQAQVYSFAR